MIKLLILHAFTIITSCGVADKIGDGAYDHAFESRTTFFIFQLKNILRSYLKFWTSYSPSTDFKSLFGLLLLSFIWLGEKISLKFLLIGGGKFVPPCSDGVDIAYAQSG